MRIFYLRRWLSMPDGNGVEYHGLAEKNPDGIPFFIQWGHRYPVLSYSNNVSSTIVELKDLEIAFKIEKLRGTVRDYGDFMDHCRTYRERHEKVHDDGGKKIKKERGARVR